MAMPIKCIMQKAGVKGESPSFNGTLDVRNEGRRPIEVNFSGIVATVNLRMKQTRGKSQRQQPKSKPFKIGFKQTV